MASREACRYNTYAGYTRNKDIGAGDRASQLLLLLPLLFDCCTGMRAAQQSKAENKQNKQAILLSTNRC